MTDAAYRFLPWVREGLAASLGRGAAGSAGRAPMRITLRVAREGLAPADVAMNARLYGPGDVVGIDPRQVIRMDPTPLTTSFEPNYLAAVEFDAPDLPWLCSPDLSPPPDPVQPPPPLPPPASRARLRPWICLVVVRRERGTIASDRKPLPVLVLADAAGELPDLAQTWAWAHAQVAGGAESVGTLLAGNPATTLSRLLCPRRLDSAVAYLACIVPTFLAGVQAGLGQNVTATVQPAWPTPPSGRIELPVYHWWEFATGADGDFESLVTRLQPRRLSGPVGQQMMDVQAVGMQLPRASASGILHFAGALQSLQPDAGPPVDGSFQTALEQRLEASPSVTGPILTPPFYGGRQAGSPSAVPAEGTPPLWLRELNLDPRCRAAAGLGARAVQEQQEPLVAAAWDQAEAIERANQLLRNAQLAQSIATSIHDKRLAPMAPEVLVQLTEPAHARVRSGAETLRRSIERTVFPRAATSGAFRRAARPAGPIAGRLADRTAIPKVVGALSAGRVAIPFRAVPSGLADIDSVSAAASRPSISYSAATKTVLETSTTYGWRLIADVREGTLPLAARALTAEGPRLMTIRPPTYPDGGSSDPRDQGDMGETLAERRARLARIRQRFRTAAGRHQDHLRVGTPPPPPPPPPPSLALDVVKKTLVGDATTRGQLDPGKTVPDRVLPLVSVVPPPTAEDRLRPLLPAPRFEQPMAEPLRARGARFLLPGLDQVPPETIGVLQPNWRFVEAYLAGANEELARTLFFRGFLTDPRATFFRRFWDTRGSVPGMAGPDIPDIDPIASWDGTRVLGTHGRGAGTGGLTVLLVRGELVRRHPGLTVYAGELDAAGQVTPQRYPAFQNRIEPDGLVVAFVLPTADLLADPAWHFLLEEHATAPRFGLEVVPVVNGVPVYGGTPASWSDVSWGHLATTEAQLRALSHVTVTAPFGELTRGDAAFGEQATWGYNGAHMARILFQDPVRVAVPARQCLPPSYGSTSLAGGIGGDLL